MKKRSAENYRLIFFISTFFGNTIAEVIDMDIRGIPVGFGYALIKDPDALRNFSILPEEQRKNVIEQVRLHSSKSEINSLIEKLACGKGF